MEQEQQISYEQLAQEYTKLALENRLLQYALQLMQFDKVNDLLKTMMEIVANKDKFSKKIVKLAEWHIIKILAKPKKLK